ncbi:hypothetical protein [Sphingorhabdus sp.]|uniref:hypothetical protein n=1 Tax=Sphingorhabdus sp. TaxID=1902408 RepID=UPI003983635B
MRQKRLLNYFVLLAFFATCACGDSCVFSKRYPDYRYRLTVEVETPEGLKTGSSVIEVNTAVSGKYSIVGPNKVNMKIRGEAVSVNLGYRGTLFALLRSEYSEDWAQYALFSAHEPVKPPILTFGNQREPTFEGQMKSTLRRQGNYYVEQYPNNVSTRPEFRNEGGRKTSNYPYMVRFRNITDPASMEAVDPNNLIKSFGEGVALRRITVERTEDAVTSSIQSKLPWLNRLAEERSPLIPDPHRSKEDTTLIRRIGSSSFSTELNN